MATERAWRRLFAMTGSLALFLSAGGLWMLAIGTTWAAILLFLCSEMVAFRAGYELCQALKVADPRSRWFRVARLLVHRDDRPPLPSPD